MYYSRETIERLGTSLSKQDLLAVVAKNLNLVDGSIATKIIVRWESARGRAVLAKELWKNRKLSGIDKVVAQEDVIERYSMVEGVFELVINFTGTYRSSTIYLSGIGAPDLFDSVEAPKTTEEARLQILKTLESWHDKDHPLMEEEFGDRVFLAVDTEEPFPDEESYGWHPSDSGLSHSMLTDDEKDSFGNN